MRRRDDIETSGNFTLAFEVQVPRDDDGASMSVFLDRYGERPRFDTGRFVVFDQRTAQVFAAGTAVNDTGATSFPSSATSVTLAATLTGTGCEAGKTLSFLVDPSPGRPRPDRSEGAAMWPTT